MFLISGIPPNRVYTHPDEQLFLLEKGLREDDVAAERLFVLPVAQGQSWSLRRMAAVFDVLPTPTIPEGNGGKDASQPQMQGDGDGDNEEAVSSPEKEKERRLVEYYERRGEALRTKEWGGKRLLLAMVDKGMGGDGTVVYYIVQEGDVKPRQN